MEKKEEVQKQENMKETRSTKKGRKSEAKPKLR